MTGSTKAIHFPVEFCLMQQFISVHVTAKTIPIETIAKMLYFSTY